MTKESGPPPQLAMFEEDILRSKDEGIGLIRPRAFFRPPPPDRGYKYKYKYKEFVWFHQQSTQYDSFFLNLTISQSHFCCLWMNAFLTL